MKKRNWLLLLLIVLCLAAFFGYRKLDQLRTDTRAPQIHIDEQPLEVSVRDDKSALLAGVTASDNVDGDVTASLVVERVNLTDSDGSISVIYAAFDSAGNVAKAKREGRYTDYERPRFTLNAPLVYTVDHSFDVLSNVGAVDAIDGDIQHRVRATTKGTSSIMALGSHMVQFQVTNSLGDTVSETFPVEVISSGIYNAALELTDYLVYLPKDAQFYPAQYLKSFTWLGEQDSLAGGLPTDYSMRTRGTVQTGYPGVYTVEYRVTFTDRDEKNPDFDRKYTGVFQIDRCGGRVSQWKIQANQICKAPGFCPSTPSSLCRTFSSGGWLLCWRRLPWASAPTFIRTRHTRRSTGRRPPSW